jgi:hypothetical protein
MSHRRFIEFTFTILPKGLSILKPEAIRLMRIADSQPDRYGVTRISTLLTHRTHSPSVTGSLRKRLTSLPGERQSLRRQGSAYSFPAHLIIWSLLIMVWPWVLCWSFTKAIPC